MTYLNKKTNTSAGNVRGAASVDSESSDAIGTGASVESGAMAALTDQEAKLVSGAGATVHSLYGTMSMSDFNDLEAKVGGWGGEAASQMKAIKTTVGKGKTWRVPNFSVL